MEIIGKLVIYVMMIFVALGAIASIRDDKTGMGREFKEGLHSIGPIFIPVAGIMASAPYLGSFIQSVTGRLFEIIGADPAMAAGAILAGDMGGYQLAFALADTPSDWIMATAAAFTAGSTIVFSIPVGLAMLPSHTHRHMALGVMSGLLAIPAAVLVTIMVLWGTATPVRGIIDTTAVSDTGLDFTWGSVFSNLLPIIIFVVVLAMLLRFATSAMTSVFLIFGRLLDAALKIVLALSIIEYFTGAISAVWSGWGFDPIIADSTDQFRALEIAGYIGIMLAGAFPMVYAIRNVLAKPLEVVGGRLGFSPDGAAGLLAASANILAMFRLIPAMPARDRVMCIAFSVCAAFTFGDHLAFMANFQPNMVLPLVIGKLTGGVLGMGFALWLAVPTVARELEVPVPTPVG